jgi:hypothetical protein
MLDFTEWASVYCTWLDVVGSSGDPDDLGL